MRPLEDVRILALEQYGAGPFGTLHLADLGAEVIKIEEPLTGGDIARYVPPRQAGEDSLFFETFNRNKRSLCVDLKSPAGREAVLRLVDRADVVIENFRPGTMDRLGLGYEALSQRNRRLVYCSEKGFLKGPYEHRTALDEVAQMMGGLAYMTGPPGKPLRAGTSVIDVQGGMFGALGVIAALFQRTSTGRGQYVEDLTAPGLAHAVFVRSPHAHARVTVLRTDVRQPRVVGLVARLRADGVHAGRLSRPHGPVRLGEALRRLPHHDGPRGVAEVPVELTPEVHHHGVARQDRPAPRLVVGRCPVRPAGHDRELRPGVAVLDQEVGEIPRDLLLAAALERHLEDPAERLVGGAAGAGHQGRHWPGVGCRGLQKTASTHN